MTDVRAEDAEFEGNAAPNTERRTLSRIHRYDDDLQTVEAWKRYHEQTVADWIRRFDERGERLVEARARIEELEAQCHTPSA